MTAFDLPVQGTIPRELHGRYVRNGTNSRTGTLQEWGFAGDGMLQVASLKKLEARKS